MDKPIHLASDQVALSILCGSKGCQRWSLSLHTDAQGNCTVSARDAGPSHKQKPPRQPPIKP